jgi:glycosyltransferase involved in cell wall biosynthesis
MDLDNQVFSHQFEVVLQLSRYFDEVRVVTHSEGSVRDYPKNVKVFRSEWKLDSNFSNTISFLKAFKAAKKDLIHFSIFSHMTEVQSFLISPFTFFKQIPHFLWYAHTSKSLYLRVNHKLLDGIITSTQGSCPIQSDKVRVIGQGIDEKIFNSKRTHRWRNKETLKAIHVGRLDPSKRLQSIIDNTLMSKWSEEFKQLVLVGAPSAKDDDYFCKLVNDNTDVIRSGKLSFVGKLSRRLLPKIFRECDVFVHSFNGSLDKSLVEATLFGIPVVSENAEYQKLFGTWTQGLDSIPVNLEREMNSFMQFRKQSAAHIAREVDRRRKIALAEHSLEQWIISLVSILKGERACR